MKVRYSYQERQYRRREMWTGGEALISFDKGRVIVEMAYGTRISFSTDDFAQICANFAHFHEGH